MPLPQPHSRACPVCDGTSRKILRDHRLAAIEEVSLHAGYQVVSCTACGMVYADQIPDQAAFDRYYQACSRYEDPTRGGRPGPVDRRRFQAIAAELADSLPDRTLSIAEMGSATGGLLAELKAAGFTRLLGVDPSPQCCACARTFQDVEVVQGTVFDPLPRGPHDLVMAVGVLEHIRDLQRAIGSLGKAVRPGGLIFLDVPDLEGFHLTNEAPFQEFSTEHINFFTQGSLDNLMARLGFSREFNRVVTRVHSGGSTMRVLASAYRKGTRSADFAPAFDAAGPAAALAYAAQCEGEAEPERTLVGQVLEAGVPFAIWGAGTVTCRLLATTGLAQAPLAFIVDSNLHLQGHAVAGFPIEAPDRLKGFQGPILVASRGYQAEILRTIQVELGLPNLVWTLDGPLGAARFARP
jgi:SAM-dependent methyltransferase